MSFLQNIKYLPLTVVTDLLHLTFDATLATFAVN